MKSPIENEDVRELKQQGGGEITQLGEVATPRM
jgi:hypothetical protein